MAAVSGAIRLADDDVGVHLGMTVVALSNVTHERYEFHLLVNGNLLVLFPSDVEKPESDAFEGTNRGQIGSSNPLLRATRRSPLTTSSPGSKTTANVLVGAF